MKIVKMRMMAKLALVISLVLVIAAVFLSNYVNIWITTGLLIAVFLLVAAFLVLSIVFWRCPSCKKRLRLYDVETEQKGECPHCGFIWRETEPKQTED